MGGPIEMAKEILKRNKEADGVFISSYNGAELYVRTKKGIRESTIKEWNIYNNGNVNIIKDNPMRKGKPIRNIFETTIKFIHLTGATKDYLRELIDDDDLMTLGKVEIYSKKRKMTIQEAKRAAKHYDDEYY